MWQTGICTACQLSFEYKAPPSYGQRKFCSRKCANSRANKKIERTIDIKELEIAYWKKNQTLRELSTKFNIPYTSLRRLLTSRDVPVYGIGKRKRFYAPRSEPVPVYPYILNSTDEAYDLVLFINRLVPRTIPEEYRPDVCQELLLVILSGIANKDEIQRFINPLIRKYAPDRHTVLLHDFLSEHI